MIATNFSVASSLIYMKSRRASELFPPGLRKLWKEWELRALVGLSLVLQIILVVLGNRRKFTSRTWLRIVLWCAYLMADWVATVALGVLSNNLGDVIESAGNSGLVGADTELTAFWAPFLLLHLGGPDTITAYSMEDNELWLRHFLGLGVQTGVALYIFILAWARNRLSVITIPMIFAGLVKYGERTWVLRSASNDQFRDSMLTSPDPGPNYPKFMQEYTLRQFEGFHVRAEEVIEAQVAVDVSSIGDSSIPDATELVIAFELFKTFNRLFVDLILSFQDRENSQSMFKDLSPEKAFKVVEIELGFMFDVLYTKAPVIYSSQGCILRFVSMSLTSIVLVVFSLFVADKEKYSKFDLALTFALLAIAIVLEIYAVLLLLSSDWIDFYLSRHTKNMFGKTIACVQLPKNPRWSNCLAQYSLLNFCLKTKPVICCTMQKLFCLDKILEKQQYKTFKQVSPDTKEMIFDHLKQKFKETFETDRDNQSSDKERTEKSSSEKDLKAQSLVLIKLGYPALTWSTELEFDQSILIWHIATELCYHADHGEVQGIIMPKCKMSKQLSRYMLYLLVMHPSMLPMGIGNIRYRDTCAEAAKFFQERKSILGNNQFGDNSSLRTCSRATNWISRRKTTYDKSQACKMLLKVNTAVPPTKVKGDRSKSVLFDACRLASQLQDISNKEAKWEMVSAVWVEMLAYAARQCRGYYHAQQLRRGGELLTHVWLLMAHLGLTEQFQISQGHARAKLVVF